jgi:hypothetical protein
VTKSETRKKILEREVRANVEMEIAVKLKDFSGPMKFKTYLRKLLREGPKKVTVKKLDAH